MKFGGNMQNMNLFHPWKFQLSILKMSRENNVPQERYGLADRKTKWIRFATEKMVLERKRKNWYFKKIKIYKIEPYPKNVHLTISKETAWFFAIILQLSNWHNYIPRNCKVIGKRQWVTFIIRSVLISRVRPFIYRW